MENGSHSQQKAQLDKAEREHLEDVVTGMRERVEDNIRFQLTQKGLDDEPENVDGLDEDSQQLVEAIELEAVDGHSWDEAFEQYVTGTGYTFVNRLAALRCMEVREFIDEEVTVLKENGLTPAAETLVHEEFLLEDEAIVEAYHNKCDELAEEIEILFDRESAYSLIDPDDDTFEELCRMLDEVPHEVWRADDVLGWIYEYYNTKLLDAVRNKAHHEGLDPDDVPTANQFYTPHWVVRMLTDNSLGKLYLERSGGLNKAMEIQRSFSSEERKQRPLAPNESPSIAEFCTYLVPSEEEGEPTNFDHPKELRVIDPACGSGHFLLYAFDVLERIWRIETEIPYEDIPEKILEHNLYGVDLDLRACQLAAFNLYLKARSRAVLEGKDQFTLPEIGIVCADSKIAEFDNVEKVFDEVAHERSDVREQLNQLVDSFEDIHGLGSLLEVRGSLSEQFKEGKQLTLGENFEATHSLSAFLDTLQNAISEEGKNSFLAKDLRSFINLLSVLSHDYDVALMNPPYGSKGRMPKSIQKYVNNNYQYPSEFYINFFEVCDSLSKQNGRIGMLVPWTFMFKDRYERFREDFIGDRGSFDFLAEFGDGILDNAAVNTVATVVRANTAQQPNGTFLRLNDLPSSEKEPAFLKTLSGNQGDIQRLFTVPLSEFHDVPRTTICYSIPSPVRELHSRNTKLDAEQGGVEGTSVCAAVPGIQTSNDDRFARYHWESNRISDFQPISKGGNHPWVLPQVLETIKWGNNGSEVRRFNKHVRIRNEEYYGEEGLTWNYVKGTGRRFGYYPGGLFSHAGCMLFPKEDLSLWTLLGVINSDLYHSLFLTQTTDRFWNAGEVGSVPWITELGELSTIADKAQRMYRLKLELATHNPVSRFYKGPDILPTTDGDFFYSHDHTKRLEDWMDITPELVQPDRTIKSASRLASQKELKRRLEIEELANDIRACPKNVYLAGKYA